jgi:hypothetical protein
MYRVKVRTLGDGQHPSEAVVSVTTAEGKQEQLIVDKRCDEILDTGTFMVVRYRIKRSVIVTYFHRLDVAGGVNAVLYYYGGNRV